MNLFVSPATVIDGGVCMTWVRSKFTYRQIFSVIPGSMARRSELVFVPLVEPRLLISKSPLKIQSEPSLIPSGAFW